MRFKNLLLAVLETAATKREAKQYMQKYGRNAAKKEVCIVRLAGQGIDKTLAPKPGRALGRTLSYLRDLGSFPIVVIDGSSEIVEYASNRSTTLETCQQQLFAKSHLLNRYLNEFKTPVMSIPTPFDISAKEGVILNQKWLKEALDLCRVPLLLPTMYDRDSNETKLYNSYDACLYLAKMLPEPYTVDKVVFIDELGGLPSQRRKNAAHVIVNLQQEYGDIGAEIRLSNLPKDVKTRHLANLDAMQKILLTCGSHTTGLITDSRSIGSQRKCNPLIHNIITDRPLISPSLPLELEKTQLRTSLLRMGLQVDVRYDFDGLDLRREDKINNINLTKLQALLESSFDRKIDMNHYLDRVQGSVAAVITVGDYAGCAIVTWETSPITNRRIAYLDKLAVDPTAQGANNVADILLIQMIRRLFPTEIVWRSRYNNRVNKWYFERSNGHMRLPDSQWTMFWICSKELPPVDEYKAVCSSIVPSLAKAKAT